MLGANVRLGRDVVQLPRFAPFASAPFRTDRPAGGFGRSGRWCGGQAMTAHDFADLFDVRRATATKDVGDIPEVG